MNDVGHGKPVEPWDGPEQRFGPPDRRSPDHIVGLFRTVVEFVGMVVLAFIAFTLNALHAQQTKFDTALTQVQTTTTRTEAKVDNLDYRLTRVENDQDNRR